MAAFLMLLPLAITSTKGWIRRMGGKRWNQLHRLVYVAAVAGCVHFLWAVKKDITEPLLYAAVFVVLFALRFVRPRQAGKPAHGPSTRQRRDGSVTRASIRDDSQSGADDGPRVTQSRKGCRPRASRAPPAPPDVRSGRRPSASLDSLPDRSPPRPLACRRLRHSRTASSIARAAWMLGAATAATAALCVWLTSPPVRVLRGLVRPDRGTVLVFCGGRRAGGPHVSRERVSIKAVAAAGVASPSR